VTRCHITVEITRPNSRQVLGNDEILKWGGIGLSEEQAYDLWLQSP